jgi:zinc transporter ZupT
MTVEGTVQGWIMVSISSFSCVLGASIVLILGVKSTSTKRCLSGSMALGSGVLIFNSLYTLLPASQQKLNSNLYTFLFFFIGVIFTVMLTWSIQWCTPLAIHTCDPIASTEEEQQKLILVSGVGGINKLVIEAVQQAVSVDNEEEVEESDLFRKPLSSPPPPPPPNHHHHRHSHTLSQHPHSHNHHHQVQDMEYGSIMITSVQDIITAEKNDYFLIGIQTAIAICIHKFPG